MIRVTDHDLEVDVLALQSLPAPDGFGSEHAALGGATCGVLSVVCCSNTVCVGTF